MCLRLWIIILGLFCVTMSYAQNKQGRVPYMGKSNTDTYLVVDTATVCVWYAFNAQDIQDESSYLDLQCLEVGKTRNKYYSYYVWESDSLITAYKRDNHSGTFPSRLAPRGRGGRGYWSEMQFHTWYIRDGKVRTYTREPNRKYNGYYDEPYADMQWKLCGDTMHISGYHCQKATTRYHGRDFVAWFSTEVPLRYGPWKFGGLPGLIVKAHDVDCLYTFELVKLEQTRTPMMSHPYSYYRPIKREWVLKFERKVNEDYHRVLGWRRVDGLQAQPIHYDPIELE